jgi:hypothetical protein
METIAVWFSCGAASAVAAMKTVEKYGGKYDVRVLNNFVLEEDEDNRRFLGDVEHWLGFKIEDVSNPKYRSCSAVGVWDQRNFMSGREGAPCTLELKKRARQLWEKENHADHHVLGFTLDEKKRHENFIKTERPLLPVLIDEGLTKADCYRIVQEAGIKLPRVYEMGYPNANCIGCVKATSPTYWNHVRKHHPNVFYQRAMQSQRIGAKLTRCHPKYLDWCYQDEDGIWHDKTKRNELYTKDGKLISPRIPLVELPPNAKGRPLKGMDFECGIFCEEKLSA